MTFFEVGIQVMGKIIVFMYGTFLPVHFKIHALVTKLKSGHNILEIQIDRGVKQVLYASVWGIQNKKFLTSSFTIVLKLSCTDYSK